MSSESKAVKTGLKESLKYKLLGLKAFWEEYKRFKIGIAGLILLLLIISMAISANFIVPADVREKWSDNPRWVYNPKLVPPEWINLFSSKKYLTPTNIEASEIYGYWKVCYENQLYEHKDYLEKLPPAQRLKIMAKLEELCRNQYEGKGYTYIFKYDLEADVVGKELMIIVKNLKHNVTVYLDIFRPDGINLTNIEIAELSPVEELPIKLKYSEAVANAIIEELIKPINPNATTDLQNKFKTRAFSVVPFIFMKAEPSIVNASASTLKGEYVFRISVVVSDINETMNETGKPEIIVRLPGACYGLLGTDARGRDNIYTILLGSQLALLLGFTYSVAAVIIGVIYGATSGFMRGSGKVWVDEAMQRVNEVLYALPVLPFLIMFSYYLRVVYKVQPNIFHIAAMLLIFGWTGVAIVTRSMALSVMGQPYIEAAVAVGASGKRILFRYVLPQLVPYTFAAMALSIPGAILMEAGLSFLGLTDPNMPSWGRMIYEAQNSLTAWWWILPPGIMITLTAVAFAFIGTALDTIVNPRLRGR